jgi:hypothetical protein
MKSETVKVFDTNLAVFYFQMWMTSQLATSPDIDWDDVEVSLMQGIILCLQSDELFKSLQQMRDQCHHACRVLHIGHRPAAPYSMITKGLGLAKAAMY